MKKRNKNKKEKKKILKQSVSADLFRNPRKNCTDHVTIVYNDDATICLPRSANSQPGQKCTPWVEIVNSWMYAVIERGKNSSCQVMNYILNISWRLPSRWRELHFLRIWISCSIDRTTHGLTKINSVDGRVQPTDYRFTCAFPKWFPTLCSEPKSWSV